jgi:Fe-coproporphyrin III synthase
MPVSFTLESASVTIAKPRPIKKLYIEITAGCNLNCPMCFRSTFDEELLPMSDSTLAIVIEQIAALPSLQELVIAGIGEPFTHPKLFDVIAAGKHAKAAVSVQTNGTLLNDQMLLRVARSGLDYLIVSYDDSETGHQLQNSLFLLPEKLKSWKKKHLELSVPLIVMETVLTADNIDHIGQIALKARAAGIWKIILTHMMPTSSELIPKSLALTGENGKERMKDFLKVVEHRMQYRMPEFELLTERRCDFIENHAAVIRFDGEVSPCYRFLHSGYEAGPASAQQTLHYSFGNIVHRSLSDIWHSTDYEAFRFKVRHWLFPSCPDCRLRSGCSFVEDSAADCWTNEPSCANCLWSRQLYLCP